MTKFLFNFLIFSFLFVSSDLFGDSVTTVKSNERFTVLSKIITTDKYSTFRAILTGPFNGGYGYDGSVSILINGQSSNYSFGNGNSSLKQSGGIDKTFVIPPGLIQAAFGIAEANAGSTYTYDLILINSCPSTAECSSITCPYCKTEYCRVHSQHYSITFKSDHCKINMHTFCTDNQAAANEYNSAEKTAKCSLCNAFYCKLCGHACSPASGDGCPHTDDCSPKTCATCKTVYCETHSFHLCSPIGNNNNNSGGSWSVWTEQVGTTENVNVQADFTPLVNAQNNANTLLNNINAALPGFIDKLNTSFQSVDDTLKNTLNPNLESINAGINSMSTGVGNIDGNVANIADNFTQLLQELSTMKDNSGNINTNLVSLLSKITDINTGLNLSNSTASDQLISLNSLNTKLSATNNNLVSLNTYAKLLNTDVATLKKILSDDVVVSLVNQLKELKTQSEYLKNDAVTQTAIVNFLNDNVHPVLRDTKVFQDLMRSDLSSLISDLSKMKTNSDSLVEHISFFKDNSLASKNNLDIIKLDLAATKLNTDNIKSNTDTIKNNTDSIKADVAATKLNTDNIKNNTDSIKADAAATKLNTDTIKDNTNSIKTSADGIKTDTQGIKTTADGIKTDTQGINDKLVTQGKTLDDINKALSPSVNSHSPVNINYPPVDPTTDYEQKIGPVSPDHNISTEGLQSKSDFFKENLENLPEIDSPSYKPLVLDIPLKTDFFDFSFSLDLNGGANSSTIKTAKSVSYSIFACFWVLSFCFLFIKTLRQW